jgi:hypothetical protein
VDVRYLRLHDFSAPSRVQSSAKNSKVFGPSLPDNAVLSAIDYGCADVFLLVLN